MAGAIASSLGIRGRTMIVAEVWAAFFRQRLVLAGLDAVARVHIVQQDALHGFGVRALVCLDRRTGQLVAHSLAGKRKHVRTEWFDACDGAVWDQTLCTGDLARSAPAS